jgi:deoxyribodipyrimidine photo-lyase
MSNKAIVWIREDFRINDNPALAYASQQHRFSLQLYIYLIQKYLLKKEKRNSGGYRNLWKILKLNYQK